MGFMQGVAAHFEGWMEQTQVAMAPFAEWKAQITHAPTPTTEFEKWLFVHIAAVLTGQKAGELLNLTGQHLGLSLEQQCACTELLVKKWGMTTFVLNQSAYATQIIIFNPAKVQERLAEVPACVWCNQLHYPCDIQPAAFVAEVGRRWQERGTIPHEIGLALGYPVKDVLGFMGLQPLDCTGCCGWRIYGDVAPSLLMSQACQAARWQALRFLYRP